MPLEHTIAAIRKPERKPLFIRWMIRVDMPAVLDIENASFEFPWSEDVFIGCLRQRNNIGMVVTMGSSVVGYFIYELCKTRIHVLNFAVHPAFRRQGVGRAMVEKLRGKLGVHRTKISLEVRETNLAAQVFFRSCGFMAISVLKDFYEDTDEDAYLMQLRGGA